MGNPALRTIASTCMATIWLLPGNGPQQTVGTNYYIIAFNVQLKSDNGSENNENIQKRVEAISTLNNVWRTDDNVEMTEQCMDGISGDGLLLLLIIISYQNQALTNIGHHNSDDCYIGME